MIDIEISTYWNVETLYYVFNGVAAIMAGAGFAGMLKMIFLFGLMIAMFSYAGNKQLEMATWFIQALIFVTLLNMPIARVAITDKTGLEPPRVVENVPFALALVAQVSNASFGWVTSTYETVFGVPDQLGLQKGDLAFGHRILKNVGRTTIRDPELRADLMQFIKECTLYDIRDGQIQASAITGSTEAWELILDNSSPARFVTYNTMSAAPTTSTCFDVGKLLLVRVDNGIAAAEAFYGRSVMTRASTDALAAEMYTSAVNSGYDWILASSQSSSNAMKQSMFNNVWREAGSELPALMNDPSRIAELQSMVGAAQAARQADGKNSTLSSLAQETLPHMRNWLEAIIYACFPLVVVLSVVVSAEGAKKMIGGYMMSIAWLGMWPVMFAIINHLSLMHLRHKMAALKLAEGVPFQMSDVFDATLSNEQAAIGYMIVLVPFLSGAIIKMGQGGFMSMADKMVTGFNSAGSAVGSSLASGNQSIGQTSMDSASVNNTSMNKYDSDINMTGGNTSMGMANGNRITSTAGGQMVLSELQNRMAIEYRTDESYNSNRSQDGVASQSASAGRQVSNRHGEASTYSAITGNDRSRTDSQHSGVTAGTTQDGGMDRSTNKGIGMRNVKSDGSETSHGIRVSDMGHANLGVDRTAGGGGGSSPGGNGTAPGANGVPSSRSRPGGADAERIERTMKGQGKSAAEIEAALANHSAGGAPAAAQRTFMDDHGNLVTPDGKPAARPGAPAAAGADPKGAKGSPAGKKGGAGFGASAGLGIQTSKTIDAANSKSRSVNQSTERDESAREGFSASIKGHRATTQGTEEQSAQSRRIGKDAVRSRVDERTLVNDASGRTDQTVSDRTSRSEGQSYSISRNLANDPDFLSKVAERGEMTPERFAGLARGEQREMIEGYLADKQVMQSARTMPKESIEGGKPIPTTAEDVKQFQKQAEGKVPDRIDQIHAKNVADTGTGDVSRVETNTALPEIAAAADTAAKANYDSTVQNSIGYRAQEFDRTVYKWASPDKDIGAGRVNLASITSDALFTDIKDSGLKTWDLLKGGDGMADGEKLNEADKKSSGIKLDVAPDWTKPKK